MIDIVNLVLGNFFRSLASFVPKLVGGLLVLAMGFIFGAIFKHLLITIFNFFRIDDFFHKTKLIQKGQVNIWTQVLAEIAKWMLVVVFLIPTLEIWGLSRAISVLNDFLYYLPNVIVAVIIAFVGLVASNLGGDLVKHSARTLGAKSANALAVFTKSTITFFTVLIILDQLGVAQDLVKILFTGIVAMISLAGGLAFGLGGKDVAKEILESLKRKLESEK
ncbi:MAG: hypothetical protein NZL96_03300 [Patescibacteria group bacterium]|nr:hypothetical protein [Patescibacteria group bacterium]